MEDLVKKVGFDKKDELAQLCGRVHGARHEDLYKKKFDWQFKSPIGDGEFFAVCLKGRIVANISSMPAKLKIENKIFDARWTCDLMVDPVYQNKGLGAYLMKHFLNSYPCSITLGVSEKSYPLMKKCGMMEIKPTFYLYRFLRPASVLAKKLKFKFFLKLAKFGEDSFKKVRNLKKTPSRCNLLDVKKLPEGTGLLLDDFNKRFSFLVVKEKSYLEWKYLNHPYYNYEILEFSLSGKLKAFIIFRTMEYGGLNYAMLSEIFYDSLQALEEILKSFLGLLYERDIDILKALITESSAKNVFKKMFFIQKKEFPGMFIFSKEIMDNAKVADSKNWFLTKGDSDLDLV